MNQRRIASPVPYTQRSWRGSIVPSSGKATALRSSKLVPERLSGFVQEITLLWSREGEAQKAHC